MYIYIYIYIYIVASHYVPIIPLLLGGGPPKFYVIAKVWLCGFICVVCALLYRVDDVEIEARTLNFVLIL